MNKGLENLQDDVETEPLEEQKIDMADFAQVEWQQNDVFDDKQEKQLESEYQAILKQLEGCEIPQDLPVENDSLIQIYSFTASNPYLNNDPNSLVELAADFLNKGNTRDGILALEAHLQKKPKDALSWRILGKIHMDNDQDGKGTRCLLNSIEIDPKNLDTLLNLGVSCANMLEELEARNHLKHWLMYNPKYQHVITDAQIIPDNFKGNRFTGEEIQKMNVKLLECFEKAKNVDGQDPDLYNCLGILYFSTRDYKSAVSSFREALRHDPNNYSLWNKLGASLYTFQQYEDGIEAYNKALELKPNYVRAWTNLGIANFAQKEYDEAIHFYLTALSLNPDARHIWSYVQSGAIQVGKYDVVERAAKSELESLQKEFDSVTPDELPAPKVDRKQLNEKYLFKEKTEDWIKHSS